MRLTHIVDRLDGIGGVQTYLTTLLPALAREGVQGAVVTNRPFAGDPGGDGVRCVAGSQSDGRTLPARPRAALAAAVRETAPDACVVHIGHSPDIAAVCAEVAPTVVFAHDYFMTCPGNALFLNRSERFCSEGPGLRCFVRAYTERTTNRRPDRLVHAYARQRAWRTGWRAATRILVASQFVADVLAGHGVPPERLAILPYFVPPAADTRSVRDVDVVFLGRLVPMKGAHVLVDSLTRVPGASAVVGGAGPEVPRLERLLEAHGLGDRVHLAGALDPAGRERLLERARLFVLPSLWAEPFGIAGLEALAAGVPVVASATGGIPSWLPDGEAGLLVPPGDADALGEALRSLLEDESRRRALAARAPAVAARFSLEAHLDGLLAVVEAACASH